MYFSAWSCCCHCCQVEREVLTVSFWRHHHARTEMLMLLAPSFSFHPLSTYFYIPTTTFTTLGIGSIKSPFNQTFQNSFIKVYQNPEANGKSMDSKETDRLNWTKPFEIELEKGAFGFISCHDLHLFYWNMMDKEVKRMRGYLLPILFVTWWAVCVCNSPTCL